MARTLTDIIPPSKRRTLEDMPAHEELSTEEKMSYRVPTPPRPRKSFPWGTAFIALLILAICVAALFIFSGTKIQVVPQKVTTNVTADLQATLAGGDLPFEIITVEKTVKKSVPAESTQTANDPASGTITIYNTQNVAQRLVKNTRFQSPEGLIFKIQDSVSIPAGSTATPGSVDAKVYAAEGGDKYNIGATKFTVPGLSGSAAFKAVTGESKAAMTGGFSGTRPSVSEATHSKEAEALKSALQNDLAADASKKVTDDFILLNGASTVTYEEIPDTGDTAGTVAIQEKGKLTAVVFPKQSLAKALATKVIGTYGGEAITLGGDTKISFTSTQDLSKLDSINQIPFSLAGQVAFEWVINPVEISGAVAGKTRDAAKTILNGLPQVDKAVITLRPFWLNTLPADPSKITVVQEKSL